MAVSIRLKRGGRKKRPFYRIVAAEGSSPRDGRFIEILGVYHPIYEPPTVEIKEDRMRHYLDNGARVSQTVKELLVRKGIDVPKTALQRKKTHAKKKKKD